MFSFFFSQPSDPIDIYFPDWIYPESIGDFTIIFTIEYKKIRTFTCLQATRLALPTDHECCVISGCSYGFGR